MLLFTDLAFSAGRSLLGRDLCGSFLVSQTMPSASWRLVWASLSPLSSPSVSWSFVHLPRPPEPSLCVVRLMCTCLGLTGLPSAPHNLCALQSVCMPPLSWHAGLPSVLRGLRVLEKFICLPTLGTTGCRAMPKGMTIKGSEHNLEHMNVKVAQSRPTLCNPMDYTIRGILQAGVVKWIAVPFSKGSSPPRDRT